MIRLRHSSKNTSAGFTIIEALVVIIIAGVLASIAAPSWFRYAANRRVDAVSTDLLQTLRRAQQRAIKERIDVSLDIQDGRPGTGELPSVREMDVSTMPPTPISGTDITLGDSDSLNPGMVMLEYRYFDGGAWQEGTTSDESDKISFDYQGIPDIDGNNDSDQDFPYRIDVVALRNNDEDDVISRDCVLIYSVLGSMRSARGEECEDFSAAAVE